MMICSLAGQTLSLRESLARDGMIYALSDDKLNKILKKTLKM